MKVLSWINVILGLWLIVAAFVLSVGTARVMADEIALGIAIAVLAYAAAMSAANAVISWCVVIAGLWTLIAPSVIAYGPLRASKINDVIVGIVVLVLAFANAVFRESPVRTQG